MKANTELLLDIIYRKKENFELYVDELNSSLDKMDENKTYIYEYEVSERKEIIGFLDTVAQYIKNSPESGIDYLKKYISDNEEKSRFVSARLSKEKIVKELVREYKFEHKRNYWNNRYVGLSGIFDNKLFCNIIRRKIDKYVYCNKVTKVKYKHLVAFLNELLSEMENSEDPLKTLKHKMKLYQKYRKKEYVEIRKKVNPKIDIIKEILEEYKKEKKVSLGCK